MGSKTRSSWTRSFLIQLVVVSAVALVLGQWGPVNDGLRSCFYDRRNVIYTTLIGLEGTILGFVIAALTIVLGYANSPRFEVLKDTRHWAGIFDAYTQGAKWTAAAVALALLGLLFDRDASPNASLASALLAVGIVAAARIAWVLYITEGVVKVVINARPRAAGK